MVATAKAVVKSLGSGAMLAIFPATRELLERARNILGFSAPLRPSASPPLLLNPVFEVTQQLRESRLLLLLQLISHFPPPMSYDAAIVPGGVGMLQSQAGVVAIIAKL